MATMTATAVHDTKTIKRAMNKIGLNDRVDDLLDELDEIELDRRLKISEEQDERGEGIPAEDAERMMREKFASGYFSQENARRRIEERAKNGR